MSTFAQMQSDLNLLGMGNLVQTDVGSLLNKCNREEVEAWKWSFLYSTIVVWGQPPYSTGTLAVTNGSNLVTGLSGALFTPDMANWWLSVGATLTTPVLVNAFIGANLLQLQTAWQGTSGTGAYSLYPLYYNVAPLIQVLRVRQIDFLTQTSMEALNRIDPSRLSTGGNPSLRWAIAPWTTDSPPNLQIELWPRPSGALPYIVEGKLGPQDMLNPNDWPQVPSLVLEAKASMYMARAVFASNGNPKWAQLADMYQTDYLRERDNARVEDNKLKITLGISASGSGRGNLGLDYYSIHDAAGPPYIGGRD